MEDHELLSEYAERQSESPFAELVARQIDLVYSTALRVVGEPHLAKDVAQMVFIGLARKPRSIRNPLALGGWLYRTTRFTAASALRREHRRRRSESIAMELIELEADSRAAWEALAPHLDAAIDTLAPADQDAVALRFFEGQSLRQVGAALGTSEDAAQKRITRALEKLRAYFARQGLATSSILIASAMAAHAVESAPAGLAASVAGTSLAGAAGGGTAALACNLAGFMTTTTLKITIAALAVLAAVSTPILLRHPIAGPAPQKDGDSSKPELALPAESGVAALHPPAAKRPAAISKPSPMEQLAQAAANNLSAEQIEAYLQQNKRSAESLLAAYRVSHDLAYLREAAAAFPKEPAVQFAAIAANVFPEQRRQWLEAFKASSPDNALAWYYSAWDYFKAHQPDLGLQELTQATGKPAFNAYAAQSSQAVEEMYDLAGRSALDAKLNAARGEMLPYLAAMKELAGEMFQVQEQSRQGGETEAADSLAYMGVALGQRLSTAANNQFLIDELVGLAIERKSVAQLDPDTAYAFLGGSLGEFQSGLVAQKEAIKQSTQLSQQVLPTLDETELASYLDRMKVYGEPAALAWLQAKHGQR
jgi:RNA polymerase sigma factor (sigma-70 family)